MLCCAGNRRRGHRRWFAQFGRPRHHGSWDFALINQQPFSLMWYFILKLRKKICLPKSWVECPQKDVLAINHSGQTTGFCVICVRKFHHFLPIKLKVKMICCQHGREFQKAVIQKKTTLFSYGFCKLLNHKVWMMIKIMIGKYKYAIPWQIYQIYDDSLVYLGNISNEKVKGSAKMGRVNGFILRSLVISRFPWIWCMPGEVSIEKNPKPNVLTYMGCLCLYVSYT